MKEGLKFLPWALLVLVVGYMLGNRQMPNIGGGVTPSPVPVVVEESKFQKILVKEDAMFISQTVTNLIKYLELDAKRADPILDDTEDVKRLVGNFGIVLNLENGKYLNTGLGDVVYTFFPFTEKDSVKDLTPELRQQIIDCWTKLKLDLDKVK